MLEREKVDSNLRAQCEQLQAELANKDIELSKVIDCPTPSISHRPLKGDRPHLATHPIDLSTVIDF